MAKLRLPKNVVIRGNDYSPILRGKSSDWDDTLYLEYSMHHGAKTHMRGIRTPEWKFMVDLQTLGEWNCMTCPKTQVKPKT